MMWPKKNWKSGDFWIFAFIAAFDYFILTPLEWIYERLPCWHSIQWVDKPEWKGFPSQPECTVEKYCTRCRQFIGCGCGQCPLTKS